ncbi:MAG: hypothetical protein R8F63_02270 [Acidimicrobiales bacterium]|nr:hypothetical protein [Acidimicrobiales bacterium]
MTDRPDSDPDPLDELVAEVLAQAPDVARLGAAQAEAWGSDVLALAIETLGESGPLLAALSAQAPEDEDAALALAAVAAVAVPDVLRDVAVPGDGATAAFGGALGTARCEGAWLLRSGAQLSAAFRFVDAIDERHVLTVDLVPGEDGEMVGEVGVGPGDLLDALEEEDAQIDVDEHVGGPGGLARRVADALASTERPRSSAVVNGHLLAARLRSMLGEDVAVPVAAAEDVPAAPTRDPEDDAYARSVLFQALPGVTESVDAEPIEVAELAELVAPSTLAPLTPAERDAVVILEWADWLGAVIGLVRAGPGTAVDGSVLVDLVNRCPEVTSTIPKADRARIEWAFAVVAETWERLGVTVDGALTERGATMLPAALAHAWRDRLG